MLRYCETILDFKKTFHVERVKSPYEQAICQSSHFLHV